MKIKSTIIALTMASCICFFSCSSPSKESTATYDIGLTESKKITLPIDENTYFLSKSIFQFEEDGKEYLHFLRVRHADQKRGIYGKEDVGNGHQHTA